METSQYKNPTPAVVGALTMGLLIVVATMLSLEQRMTKLSRENEQLRSLTLTLDKQLSVASRLVLQQQKELAAVPANNPTLGPVTSGFGTRVSPFSGRPSMHLGIDIGAPKNAMVNAPASGTVMVAEYRGSYGRYVEIDHGYGFVTKYAHASKLLVKPGQKIDRGQAIARVGSSGRSTGHHLHYEVWFQGHPVDPQDYLQPQISDVPSGLLEQVGVGGDIPYIAD